jgi:hypothetical protein
MTSEIEQSIPSRGSLFGVTIRASRALVGSKRAVMVDDKTLLVSPAMLELMTFASPEELQSLWENIGVIKMPDHCWSPEMPMWCGIK